MSLGAGERAPRSRGFVVGAALLLTGFFLGLGLGRRVRLAGPATVAVHISGAVANPGFYEFPAGTRLAAALEEAAALPEADLDAVNLAERLFDGQRVVLPGNLPPPPAATTTSSPPPTGPAPSSQRATIDLNSAGAELLESLPGIGEVKAAAIIAWRQENGLFATVDDILLVPGIGPITLERVRPLVTAGQR